MVLIGNEGPVGPTNSKCVCAIWRAASAHASAERLQNRQATIQHATVVRRTAHSECSLSPGKEKKEEDRIEWCTSSHYRHLFLSRSRSHFRAPISLLNAKIIFHLLRVKVHTKCRTPAGSASRQHGECGVQWWWIRAWSNRDHACTAETVPAAIDGCKLRCLIGLTYHLFCSSSIRRLLLSSDL